MNSHFQQNAVGGISACILVGFFYQHMYIFMFYTSISEDFITSYVKMRTKPGKKVQ